MASAPQSPDVYKYDVRPSSVHSTPTTNRYAGGEPTGPPARRSPGSPSMGMYFSPTPQKTISVLNRPKNPPPSMKNVENLDTQFEKDKQAADRHSAASRRLQVERWHHHGPGTQSLLDQGHIVDRGRGKTVVQAANGVFDPILSEFKVPPWGPQLQGSKDNKRPSSAPHMRPGTPSHRGDKHIQQARGVRDPITGVCKPGFEPSHVYEARKQLEFERNHGGRGILSRADKDKAFNPITGEQQPLLGSPGPVARSPSQRNLQQRPMSAPRGSVYSASVTLVDKPDTPSKRQITSGPSWGAYNPITHAWHVPPSDAKFHDPSAQVNKTHGVTGAHWRKVALPANQGIYNPILNQWVVPPANPRVQAGLSFAPATLFSRPTAATIRSPH